MNFSLSHKILSSLMALVVLFSTLSFTISEHFCGDILMDTAIFGKVKPCCKISVKDFTPLAITKGKCCSDNQTLVKGQDILKLDSNQIVLEHHVFVVSFISTYIALFQSEEKELNSFLAYSPPLVWKAIFKRDQTYLI